MRGERGREGGRRGKREREFLNMVKRELSNLRRVNFFNFFVIFECVYNRKLGIIILNVIFKLFRLGFEGGEFMEGVYEFLKFYVK